MPRKKVSKKNTARWIRALQLRLPATSANLGPAFDAAAVALDLYLKLAAGPAAHFSITASGRDREVCENLENHLILNTYREVLSAQGRDVTPLSLRIQNEIPIGKGCGSSAAARLAGIALANHFGGLRWNEAQIISEASRREHHPDNASACWMGGLTIARMSGEGEVQAVCLRPRGKWPLLLALPAEALSTELARKVLPAHYSRADAVVNVQNCLLLLAAFTQGRPDLLSVALEDRIHQPYRSRLCPLLPALQPLTGKEGVLGVALSGAGPSVLILLDPRASVQKARKSVESQLARRGLTAEVRPTSMALRGARSPANPSARR